MTIRRFCQSTIYYTWLLLAIIVIVAALAVSSLRLLVPHAEHIKKPLTDWFADNYQMELDYQQLHLSWQRFGLYVALTEVDIEPLEGEPDRVKGVAELSMRIDPFASLLAGAARFGDIRLHGVELDISSLNEGGKSGPESPLQQLMLELVSSRFEQFELTDFTIHLGADELPSLHIPRLVWTNQEQTHQGQGTIQLAGTDQDSLKFIVKMTGNERNRQGIKGQLYLDVTNLAPHQFTESYLGLDVVVTGSQLNFESWVNFSWDSVDQVILQLQQNSLSWQLPREQGVEPHQLLIERGYLVYEANDDDWQVFSSGLDVHTNGQLWHDLNLKLWQQDGLVQSSIEYVDLSLIAPLMEWIPKRWKLPIPQQVPLKGSVEYLSGQYRHGEEWQLSANFSDVGWARVANMPGTEMINGAVYLDQDLLQLRMTAPAQVISTGDLFYQNIELEWFNGFFQAERQDWGWQFEIPQLSLQATDLTAEVSAKGRFGPELPTELYLYGELDLADAGHADYYFPLKAMGLNLAGYLSDSLLAGQVEQAKILWHGPLGDFPYDNGRGMFQASVPLRDGTFKFSPDWPALEPLDLDLLFENNDLLMTGRKARLYNVHVDDLVAKIPGLAGDSVLSIDGNISGSATSVRAVMADSMLADTVGASLESLNLTGPVWGPLSLAIPLDQPQQVKVEGFAQLEQASLTIPGTESHIINDATARVVYQQQGFEIEQLTGLYHGLPVTASVVGDQTAEHYQVDGEVHATWQAEGLKQLPGFWVPGLSGDMVTEATIQARIDRQGTTTEIDIRSDLTAMTVDLPAPFFKSASTPQSLNGRIEITADNQFNMNFALADYGQLRWQQDISELAGEPAIWVGVGAEPPSQLVPGLQVDVAQQEVDLTDWLAVLEDHDQEGQEHSDTLPFDRGTWQFNKIRHGDWFIDNPKVELVKTPLGWQAKAQGEGVQGDVYYEALERPIITVKLDHLHLQQIEQAPQQTESLAGKPPLTAANAEQMAKIPDLDVLCSNCSVAELNLGNVRLKSYTLPEQGLWRVEEAWLRNPHGEIVIDSFEWLANEQGSNTKLTGQLATQDFGKYAESFMASGENPIKQSSGEGKLQFSWPGAPYQLDVATLDGNFKWELGPGHVAELSDKGARVFTLLSIDSLVRKMRLDFSDVFDKGLHYNSFEGDFVFKEGYVNSEQLVMDGVAGDMFINGRTNLVTRELDYDVVFNPNLTGSLPLLSALTFNPITGVYVLALSAVIKPAVAVVTQVRFKVSGTTADPVVEEVGRSQKELELQKPAQQTEPAAEASSEPANAQQAAELTSQPAQPQAATDASDQLLPELPPEQPLTVGDNKSSPPEQEGN